MFTMKYKQYTITELDYFCEYNLVLVYDENDYAQVLFKYYWVHDRYDYAILDAVEQLRDGIEKKEEFDEKLLLEKGIDIDEIIERLVDAHSE